MNETKLTYTEQVIEEIASFQRKNQCCRRAFLLGMLFGGAKVDGEEIRLKVKTEALCEYSHRLIREQLGRDAEIFPVGKRGVSRRLCFVSSGAASMIGDSDTAYAATIKCPSCAMAFISGIFCTAGSVSDPSGDYYLSMRIQMRYRECVSLAMMDAQLSASTRTVGDNVVFYIRASSKIEDFLAVCGVQRLLFDIMNLKIEKEIRNNANRISNIDYNNIQKTVGAAQKYIEAIEWLEKNNRLTSLTSELYEAAILRVKYPDCSFASLGAMMTPTVSKSGVVHRLRRIYEIYEKAQRKER